MKVEYKNDSAHIKDAGEIVPQHIFENGQFFRYTLLDDKSYDIYALDKYLNVRSDGDILTLTPCVPDDFENFWRNYFDLDTRYDELFKQSQDANLQTAIKKFSGLKILRQDPFETLISFIISANNNIGRIKGIIERLCEKYGSKIETKDGAYYSFPTPAQLAKATISELKALGCGYRAPYIAETAQAISGGFDLKALKNMEYEEAKKRLLMLKGVGTKVADCILLFSLGHYNAFPKDVWVKRVMNELYNVSGSDRQVQQFAEEKFGKYAGIAQQYLFYAARRGELNRQF